MSHPTPSDRALLAVLQALAARGYQFVTPTPATHARVSARLKGRTACDMREVFGWSLPFRRDLVGPDIFDLLRRGGALDETRQGFRSRLRVSSLDGGLFLHSAYPAEAEDAVFFGPDSYRFAALIAAEAAGLDPAARVVDIGAGAGVGAIAAARLAPGLEPTLTDVNPSALRLARINAAFARVTVRTRKADGLKRVAGSWDLALANPPYIAGSDGPAYREGGDMHGARLSLELACAAAERLAPGGRLILYTGAAIVGGRDALREALEPALAARGCSLRYRELDPDVFGEELAKPAYAEVERIAVIAAVAVRESPRP